MEAKTIESVNELTHLTWYTFDMAYKHEGEKQCYSEKKEYKARYLGVDAMGRYVFHGYEYCRAAYTWKPAYIRLTEEQLDPSILWPANTPNSGFSVPYRLLPVRFTETDGRDPMDIICPVDGRPGNPNPFNLLGR